jgi:hypothetical protein
MKRIYLLAALSVLLAVLVLACFHGNGKTYHGYGRYTLRVDLDEVVIGSETYKVTRQGDEMVIGGHTIARGIYRKTEPWLYVHNIDAENDKVDVTFEGERGGKKIYPLYTGSSASIFAVFKEAGWEMERSTCALFDDAYLVWLVSHRWSPDGIYFDIQIRTGDETEWDLFPEPDPSNPDRPGNFFVENGAGPVLIEEVGAYAEILEFTYDDEEPIATVKFTSAE